MLPLAELAPWTELGAGGLVGVVAIMVFTGRLVPSGTVEKLLAARDRIIEQQQATIDRQNERGDLSTEHLKSLLESSKTSAHVIEEIRALVKQRSGEDA